MSLRYSADPPYLWLIRAHLRKQIFSRAIAGRGHDQAARDRQYVSAGGFKPAGDSPLRQDV
jgi:hypothetical protein